MLKYVPFFLAAKVLLSVQPLEQELIVDKFQRLRKSYRNPKYPVVLCHGLSGFDRLSILPPLVTLKPDASAADQLSAPGGVYFDYWHGIKDALEANGCTVVVAKVPAFGSIEDRSKALNLFIENKIKHLRKKKDNDMDQIYNDDNKAGESEHADKIKVNLIAHSMGGLDSRYLISQFDQKNYQVMSLTTVSTPHHGSTMLDHVVEVLLPLKSVVPPSIRELTTQSMLDFNKKVKDDPAVKYFSYGAKFQPNLLNVFYYSWKVICEKEGDNDGMVSVDSSKWGKYLGTLDGVDHLDLINWTNNLRNLYWSYVQKKEPNFNAVLFYLDIVDQLALEGC